MAVTQAASATAVLEKLAQGNKRFVAGTPEAKNLVVRRAELAKGQKPGACVITCSDSRVCPEYIFDTSLGDLFVVRTAGNVVGHFELGSVEYAVEHLHVAVVIVLGHTACGAVTAACEAGAHDKKHDKEKEKEKEKGKDKEKEKVKHELPKLVEEIEPSAKHVGYNLLQAIDENVKNTYRKVISLAKRNFNIQGNKQPYRERGYAYWVTSGYDEVCLGFWCCFLSSSLNHQSPCFVQQYACAGHFC